LRDQLLPALPDLNIESGYWLQVNPDSKEIARVPLYHQPDSI
jgi:hypothetical protein